MKNVRLFGILASFAFVSFAASAQVIENISIQAGSSVVEQLLDGRLVQFSCAPGGTTPQAVAQPTECRAILTISVFGEEKDYPVTGDSPTSKYDAIMKLRANCKGVRSTLIAQGFQVPANLDQTCDGFSEANNMISCKPL